MATIELKPFQVEAASTIVNFISQYSSSSEDAVHNRKTGKLEPFVCQLKAITGAGKTPMLAQVAQQLGNSIILWTTNRGAIIEQTLFNFRSGGKYHELLPAGTDVYKLGDMSDTDWASVMEAKTGISLLVATVASFNQDGDKLRIHKASANAGASRWEMLSGDSNKLGFRKRTLYIFYDEGHGATESQFARLTSLRPQAFILASAAEFPTELVTLLPNETPHELLESLKRRTIIVPTAEVAEAGLLKDTLYFTECNVGTGEALSEAVKKHQHLTDKLSNAGEQPIACYIVNNSLRGVVIWKELRSLGVPAKSIAVHVDGAMVIAANEGISELIDTYTGKKNAAKSPAVLKAHGYTHIIWNLTLREGWDEPYAYVAYIDGKGKSSTDIIQKIGRFIRQPHAKPYNDPDLNAAYFYFNVQDKEFRRVIENTQHELQSEGYEVHYSQRNNLWPDSIPEPVKNTQRVPIIDLNRGKASENDRIALEYVALLDESERRAPGSLTQVALSVIDGGKEDASQSRVEYRDSAGKTTVWEVLSRSLRSFDSRIMDEHGGIFTEGLSRHKVMIQEIEYGSVAITRINNWYKQIIAKLQENLEFFSYGIEFHEVQTFPLRNPNVVGVSTAAEFRYKVRTFHNAIHARYNDFNEFEESVAYALDRIQLPWCRNPVGPLGYGIPIPIYGNKSKRFMPDFLLFTDKKIWVIEPKGDHLAVGAIRQKLLDLRRYGIEIAFVLEGGYEFVNGSLEGGSPNEITLIKHMAGGIRPRRFDNLDDLFAVLLES